MSRALGLHAAGDRVRYALVEADPDGPPRVLAAGEVAAVQLPGTYRTLAAGRLLPWGAALAGAGRRPERLPAGWSLRHPATQALAAPAVAAAHWHWRLGRIDRSDLFLWLSEDRLHWCAGEPGGGDHGSRPRRSPVPQILTEVLERSPNRTGPVAVACDRQAPGLELLGEALERAGRSWRLLRPDPTEGGVDPAAAGAALGALDPGLPGFRPPLREGGHPARFWVSAAFLAIGLAVLAAWSGRQSRALDAALAALAERAAPAEPRRSFLPLPRAAIRALDRRAAFGAAFTALLEAAPAGSLQRLELFSSPDSGLVEVRLEVADQEAPFRPEALGPDLRLRPGAAREGTVLWSGRARPPAAPEPRAGARPQSADGEAEG
ncbi:MAG: hypothetical protein D6702_02790 [Planctomycetota bacterium]|nr:MAG: hypothetical protein D6702_02790 [Planctomycetota bacterium]